MEFSFSQIDLKEEAGVREKVYFGIILLLIVVLFARWFYVPKMKQIKLLQVEVKNNRMQIDTLKQFANLKIPVAKPQTSGEQTFGTGTKFEKAIEASMKSPQQVVAEIIRMLTDGRALGNVSLSGMAFGTEVDKGTYSAVPVEITLEGRYAGILGYLEYIEKFGKLVTADNIELTADEKTPSRVHARITASIYVVHPKRAPLPTPEVGR